MNGQIVKINDKIVQLIFWIYTLECQIYKDLNQSFRSANSIKDLVLPNFTSALRKIINNNSNLTKKEY